MKAITELGVEEALVSLLDAKGTPSVVERAFVLPPRSRLAPLSPEERARSSAIRCTTDIKRDAVDRSRAYEKLKEKAAQRQAEESAGGADQGAGSYGGRASGSGPAGA